MKITDLILRLLIAALVMTGYFYLNQNKPIVENILIHLLCFAGMLAVIFFFFRFGWKNIGYGTLIGLFIAVGAAIIYVMYLLLGKL